MKGGVLIRSDPTPLLVFHKHHFLSKFWYQEFPSPLLSDLAPRMSARNNMCPGFLSRVNQSLSPPPAALPPLGTKGDMIYDKGEGAFLVSSEQIDVIPHPCSTYQ